VKPRHAAALALVGWYLMAPPIRPGGGVDLKAPMSQWDQDDDFDRPQLATKLALNEST